MDKMENITQIVQHVKQAPWRVQRQWIGLLLLGLVLAAMVAGIYINVTARASISGRQIQGLTADIERIGRDNADKETELAGLTSSENMQARAEALGFHPASGEEITYLAVPGYEGKTPADLSTQSDSLPAAILKGEYSETLFDWFTRQMTAAGAQP
jgi:hypothetical protein